MPALQGIEDHFLEQWHQKLHTNTTPEDITICEAYLTFLHSGYDGDFWRVLWDNGQITRDMLATMDHPITGLHACPPAPTAASMQCIRAGACCLQWGTDPRPKVCAAQRDALSVLHPRAWVSGAWLSTRFQLRA